jgi:type 1 fimbriae regulatory protein FimE
VPLGPILVEIRPVTHRNSNRPPRRLPNAALRSREYLTDDEVSALIKAARSVGRNRLRDATLILVSYRHGLRVSEAADLRWEQVDFKHAMLHVRRLKNGTPSTHPLGKTERHDLKRLRWLYPDVSMRNIHHTVRYTELSPERFRGFWND